MSHDGSRSQVSPVARLLTSQRSPGWAMCARRSAIKLAPAIPSVPSVPYSGTQGTQGNYASCMHRRLAQVACCQMAATQVDQRRLDLGADVDGQGAAPMEAAAARRIERAGHVAFEDNPLALERRVGHGNSRHERLRIRMLRIRVHLV